MDDDKATADVLKTIANQVNEMYQSWPTMRESLLRYEQQQAEHERRIKALEGKGPMNTPIVIAKLIIVAIVVAGIMVAVILGKIPHDQAINDITIVVSALVGALGLAGAANAIASSRAQSQGGGKSIPPAPAKDAAKEGGAS